MAAGEATKALVDKLKAGVEDVFSGERFREWLDVQARFHTYSFANTILIWLQRPGATYVAGYQQWINKFERHVKKGEKGIKIFAPHIRKEKDAEGNETERLVGFFPVTVFDVSQTEGKELPSLARSLTGSSDEALTILNRVAAIAAKKGISVRYLDASQMDVPGAHGYFEPPCKIAVRYDAADQMAKTLVHEYTHSQAYKEDGNRREAEIVAEGAAYVVCTYFGLDTSDYSFDYVAAWASRTEDRQDTLRRCASRIQKLADSIINEVEAEQPEQRQAAD